MKKTQLFLIMLLVGIQATFAQSVQVNGKVTYADDGSPVIGATINVKGSAIATATDVNGNYKITIPTKNDKVLVFKALGLETQEVATPTTGTYNVELKSEALTASDVVVTGYGNVSRKSYGGSAAVISTAKLQDVPSVSVQSRLAGAVPGLTVTSASGQPGSVESVRIRGMGSINAGNEPLYVLDGIPIQTGNASGFGDSYGESGNSMLAALNPSDIESMTVIKDAAAASLYGSRAANGVIVITTKKGVAGKTRFNVKADVGFSDMAINYRPTLDGQQRRDILYLGFQNYAKYNQGMTNQAAIDAFANGNINDFAAKPWSGYTDWRDVLLRNGLNQNYEISAQGGNEKTRFYTSLSYTNQKGITYEQEYKRITGRVNLDHKAGILTLNASSLFSSVNQRVNSEGTAFSNPIMMLGMTVSPTEYVYNEDGSINLDPDAFPAIGGGLANPVWEREINYNKESMIRSLSNISAQLDIVKGFAIKQTLSYDYIHSGSSAWWDPRSNNGEASQGVMQRTSIVNSRLNSQTMASYNNVFNDVHNLSALVAFEAEANKEDYLYANGNGYPSYQKPEIENAATTSASSSLAQSTLLSWVGKLDYTYDNRYYVGGSFRSDGSSRLSPENRWGNFWSVSAYWRLSQEHWWKDGGINTVLTEAKIRASYGENGTQPSNWYDWMGIYSYGYNYNGMPGSAEKRVNNPDLSWERNLSTNVGFDVTFIDRISLSFDWYNRETKDLILAQPVSQTTGFATTLKNVGAMRNRGFEIDLRATAIQTRDVQWILGLNIAHNNNTLISLNDGTNEMVSTASSNIIHRVGESFYSYNLYEYAGVDAATGNESFYLNTVNEDGTINRGTTTNPAKAQRVITGNAQPTITGGITSQFSYKWLDFGFTFTYSLGGSAFDNASWIQSNGGTYNYIGNVPDYYKIEDTWQNPGDNASLPKFQYGSVATRSSRWQVSTDHLRLKNVTLGFSAPKAWTDKMTIQKLRIFASASNLFTIKSKDLYFDPETRVDGLVTFQSPALRTITFGIEVGF